MISWDEIDVDYELPSLTKGPITQLQLIKYAGASGDFNQIHTVPDYAKEAGLDGTIVHGMLVMGILGQMITSFAGPKMIKKYSAGFKSITRPGDILIAKGIVKKKYEKDGEKLIDCRVYVEDSAGDLKVDGKVTIAF